VNANYIQHTHFFLIPTSKSGRDLLGNSFLKVAEDLAELFSGVLWNVELVQDEFEHLAEKIAKQTIESRVLFLFPAYSKT
jgi:hypothetical protein